MVKKLNSCNVSNYEKYKILYSESIENQDEFLRRITNSFYWNIHPINYNYSYNFDRHKGKTYVEYLSGAQTNICYNALDRVINNGFGSVYAYHW